MSLLELPTELFRLIAGQLPRGAVFNILQTCRKAYHLAREFLFHSVVLGREGSSAAFLSAVSAGQISDSDLQWVWRLTIPETPIFFDEFLCTVLPRLHHLRQVDLTTPSKENPPCLWIKSPVLATLPAGVRVSANLSASVSVPDLLLLPLLLQRPESIIDLRIDICNITSVQLELLYVLLGTFHNLHHLTVTTLAEHIRPRERQLIPFNFIHTGFRFSPPTFPGQLTHLDFYPTLTSPPPLPATLTSLILHMPLLTPSLVAAIFSLPALSTLRLIEPLPLSPLPPSLPPPAPSFRHLKNLLIGELSNRRHYHSPTLPGFFLPHILRSNPGLQTLTLPHLSDAVLCLLPPGLRELSALFTFDSSCQQAFSMAALTAALAQCKALRRCWLPFSVVMVEGREMRVARIDRPLLRAVVEGCALLEELTVVDMDSDFSTDKGEWEKEAAKEMCADEETYRLLERFFTVGSDAMHPVIVQCVLDKAGLGSLR